VKPLSSCPPDSKRHSKRSRPEPEREHNHGRYRAG
jgi:hypothetical protein